MHWAKLSYFVHHVFHKLLKVEAGVCPQLNEELEVKAGY